MKKIFKAIIIMLILFSTINIFNGCMKEKNKNKEYLNILIEGPKESDNDFINIMIEEYKKENQDVNIKIEISKNIEESRKILNKNKFDLIFCARNSMIEFSRKGLLKDIGSIYNSATINLRFYNIVCSYGRYNNTYFGIGLMPYSLSLLSNKNILGEFLNNNEVLDLNNIIKLTSEYNKQIPVVIPKDMSISLALGSFVANNIILDNKLEENFSDNKSKYMKINEIQKSFSSMNSIIRKLKNNEISFVESDKKAIFDIKDEKNSLALTTTLSFKDIEQNKNFKIITNILDNKYKISPVVIIDHNLCAFEDGKNEKQINKFFHFVCKDDIYIQLAKKGYISGNAQAVTYLEGEQRDLMWTISLANENNIPFYLNLSTKMQKAILEELNNIMNGNYDGQEWKRIIEKSF